MANPLVFLGEPPETRTPNLVIRSMVSDYLMESGSWQVILSPGASLLPTRLHLTPFTFTLAIPSEVPSTQLISGFSNPYPAHHLFHDHFEHRKMVISCTSITGNP